MRNRVIAELRRAPDGLGVRELTERVGLHPNSVRWHLASLERDGLLVSAPLQTMRPGRPRIIYRLRPAGLAGTRDEYRMLATVAVMEEQGFPPTVASARSGSAAARSRTSPARSPTWSAPCIAE